MKANTSHIMHLTAAIKNLNQVKGDGMIAHINRGQLIQLQNELDIQLEILRLGIPAPKQRKCCA